MSSEAVDQAKTNEEAAHLAAAEEAEARRVVLLWQRPILPDREVPNAIDLPQSVWERCKADGDTPPLFTIGRRLYVRTKDLAAWIDAKAREGRPGSKRLRERREREAA
jgi:hypothetical protein